MPYCTFQEYLDRNKNLQTKPTVKQVADYEGTVETKPQKEKKHADAGGAGQTGDMKPYKAGSDAADRNKSTMKGGLADHGDKNLKYEPKNMVANKGENMPGGTKKASWPKTPTQEWIEKTKNLSLAEFTKTVKNDALAGYSECGCQEAPSTSIKKTVEACKCNQRNVSSLVREMKRNGLFSQLVEEMANHQETFAELAQLMEEEVYAKKLAKAMNEMVAPPVGGDEPSMSKKKPMPTPMSQDMGDEDMDMGDEDSMDDEDMDMGDDEDMGDDSMDDENMDDEDIDMGDEDSMDDEDMDMGDEEDMGDDSMGDEEDMGDMSTPKPKSDDLFKRKSNAHQNLMSAMMNYR